MAAELLKRGLQTSVTFGNAKAIDLLAHNPTTGKNFTVQVKALRKTNYFPIKHSSINASHIYVFVILNAPGTAVDYFIVPGSVLANEPEKFGRDFHHPTFPGIRPKSLKTFAGAWHIFEQQALPVSVFPSATLLAAFEGGAVYTADQDGQFLLIINQVALLDLLDAEDREGAEAMKVLHFNTSSSRDKYIEERGWSRDQINL